MRRIWKYAGGKNELGSIWVRIQRKLGSNTSLLRTNRILRLDIDEAWYITSQYMTKE